MIDFPQSSGNSSGILDSLEDPLVIGFIGRSPDHSTRAMVIVQIPPIFRGGYGHYHWNCDDHGDLPPCQPV